MLHTNRLILIAPMMDWTDRHCRYFLRLISKNSLLYTEMVTSDAILHGDQKRFLHFNEAEHPIALQLGGSDPNKLAQCAKLAEAQGYDEINLNVGCPSDRVQSGFFGACLMAKPQLVAECIRAMQDVVNIPVTVKTRIGIDDKDSYEELVHFVETIANAGCNTFIIHARKAWLEGLSPKQNRDIPPLRYDVVERLKQDFPALEIIINGGITTLDIIHQQLKLVDGVMIGREAYKHPYFIAEFDRLFFDSEEKVKTRHEIIHEYLPYVDEQLQQGVPLQAMTRHILGLFHGEPGAKVWRRYLSQNAYKQGAGVEVIEKTLELMSRFDELTYIKKPEFSIE